MYCVLDLETTGTTTYKRFCNPLDERHSITAAGFLGEGEESVQSYYSPLGLNPEDFDPGPEASMLVGQNLKFDLQWLWKTQWMERFLDSGGQFWDTLSVEYLLSGQIFGKKDLNTLAMKYGGTLKDERVSELFAGGVLAKDIPEDLLVPYMEWDIINTELIFKKQYEEIVNRGMLPLIRAVMAHYMVLTDMEVTGIEFDKQGAEIDLEQHTRTLDKLRASLVEFSPNFPHDQITLNLDSTAHIRAILMGGEVKEVRREALRDSSGQPSLFQSGLKKGQPRFANLKLNIPIAGMLYRDASSQLTFTEGGKISTDESSLAAARKKVGGVAAQFIDALLHYRQVTKLVGTYLYSEKTFFNWNI